MDGEEAGHAQVRDSDSSIEVIPVIGSALGYRPLAQLLAADPGVEIPELAADAIPDREAAFALASSTVRLPGKFSRYDSVFEAVINQLEDETPSGWAEHYLLKGSVALLLVGEGRTTLNGIVLSYSPLLGLFQPEESQGGGTMT